MGGEQSKPAPEAVADRAPAPAPEPKKLTLLEELMLKSGNAGNALLIPFQKTPSRPPLPQLVSENGLQVEKAYACGPGCRISIDSTLTSSSLVLSRDILGKLPPIDTIGAPSDTWVWDPIVEKDPSTGKPLPFASERSITLMNKFKWNGAKGAGGWYRRANPELFGKGGTPCCHGDVKENGDQWEDNNDQAHSAIQEDIAAWQKDQDEHDAKLAAKGKSVNIWNTSDDNIVALNTETYGALTKLFVKPTIPFKVSFSDGMSGNPILNATLMSVYHPCPLRIETVQYDAVIQIGDFRGMAQLDCQQIEDETATAKRALKREQAIYDRQIAAKENERKREAGGMWQFVAGARGPNDGRIQAEIKKLEAKKAALKPRTNRICNPSSGTPDPLVIFIPLKINDVPSETQMVQTRFINTFASKISNILNQQPSKELGYPDVPAITNNDWKLSDILDPTDCYYTWKQPLDGFDTPTTVIFMKNPVSVFSVDMASIQRLPITQPSDVFHSMPGDVRFKSCLPKVPDGQPGAGEKRACPECQKAPPPLVPNPIAQMRAEQANDKSKSDGNLWISILLGMIGTIAIIIGAWFGIKFALGPGGELMKKLADKIGGATASAYSSIKKSTASLPSLPTSTPKFPRPPPPSSSPILPGAPARFLRRTRRRFANALGIGQRVGPQARRVTQSRGTAEGVGLDSALNAANPMSKNFFTPGKTRSPAEIADAAPANIPEPTGDFVMNNPGFKDKDAFIKAHRRTARHVPKPKTRPVDDTVAAPKPEGPAKKVIVGPSETPAEKIARLAKAKKALRPVKKRNIGPIEEPDTPKMGAPAMLAKKLSDRAKKARESVSDFDKAVENTPKKATIFDSPATRARLGIPEERSTEPQYLATASTVKKAGKGRRSNRFKTGRRV
jgi:hypothetical protein